MSTSSLVRQIRDFLARIGREHGLLLQDSDRLVVAVSGGPDSQALLHLLARQRLRPPGSVVVAHLDHGLRPEATAEAETVAGLARDWGLTARIERADVRRLAREKGLSLEEAGRKARYGFLARVARQEQARVVATGHHAGDQVETVLLHFLRGSGGRGLQGMKAVASLPGADGIWLIRPLLSVGRAAIETYVHREGMAPVLDETNADPTFLRNRIRHELLEMLEAYNPGIRDRLLQLAAITQGEQALIEQLTEDAWQGSIVVEQIDQAVFGLDAWRRLPLALRRATLRCAVDRLRPTAETLGFRALELAREVAESGNVGAQADLPGTVRLRVGYETFAVSVGYPTEIGTSTDRPQLRSNETVSLPVPGRIKLAGAWYIESAWLSDFDLAAVQTNADPWTAFIDGDSAGSLTLRPRQSGERFRPLGMGGRSARLGEVMIDRKIPRELRGRWPLVANQEHAIWLVGHQMDQRARVTASSGRVVQLRAVRTDEGV